MQQICSLFQYRLSFVDVDQMRSVLAEPRFWSLRCDARDSAGCYWASYLHHTNFPTCQGKLLYKRTHVLTLASARTWTWVNISHFCFGLPCYICSARAPLGITTLPLVRVRSIMISMFVCLSVRLFTYLVNHTSRFHQTFSTCYLWSWLGHPLIRYVLPVLWMTSCFHIIEQMGRNRRRHVCFV